MCHILQQLVVENPHIFSDQELTIKYIRKKRELAKTVLKSRHTINVEIIIVHFCFAYTGQNPGVQVTSLNNRTISDLSFYDIIGMGRSLPINRSSQEELSFLFTDLAILTNDVIF